MMTKMSGVSCVFALEFEGINTVAMESAKKALDYLSLGSPDQYPCLIIVDFMMADMTGIEFIKKVRSDFATTLGKIPVALSTARCRYELSSEGMPADILLLEKPLDLAQFLKVVKEYYSDSPQVSSL